LVCFAKGLGSGSVLFAFIVSSKMLICIQICHTKTGYTYDYVIVTTS
jgi:hypothetical protein